MNRSRTPRSWPQNREASPVEALNRSIADLEARIEGLNARSRRTSARADNLGTASEMVMRQRMLEREQRGRQRPQSPPQPPRHEAPRHQPAATQSAMRETSDAMRDIAEALVSLRDDLHRDISDSMSREFGALRRDVDEIKALSGTAATRPDISQDLAHLAHQLEELENRRADNESRRADSQGAALRAELDDLRTMVNDLAREDSMRRLENRWDGFEERISGMDPASIREDLITLSYRLDDIKSSIGQLPSALPLHALEDKIKMLVAAIDAMSRQPGAADPEVARQFAMLDERLDEISRAIVASSVSQTSGIETADIQRLETRLDAVVEHIGRLGQSERDNELADRIEHLSTRVEEMVSDQAYTSLMDRLDALSESIGDQPSATDPQLIGQLEDISRKVDSLDLGAVNEHLADQLQALSMRIDHINGDLAATNSNQDMLYGRLETLADRVEESVAQQGTVDFTPLEARLADLAARLDDSPSQNTASDEAIRNLEAQLANLSQLLASPDIAGGANAALEPRLAAVEDHLQGGNQDLVIETARQAAEAAVANYQQKGAPAADVSTIEALVGDLRSLEDLSRKSEERNARTIDAVHDTLLKIANRLERLEGPHDAPHSDHADTLAAAPATHAPETHAPETHVDAHAPEASAADLLREEHNQPMAAESGPADKPFLSGLVSRVKGKARKPADPERRDVEAAPSIDPVADIDPETANMPLEPGSGAPDIKRIMAKVREAQSLSDEDHPYTDATDQARADKADFIAAARRAARAAASEAADLEQSAGEDAKPGSLKQAISRRRRPLLLAAGAILLAVLSYPLISGFVGGDETQTQTAALEQQAEMSPAVTEPVPGADQDLPRVEVAEAETESDVDGGILVTRSTEATVNADPPQMLSTGNKVQATSSFVPSGQTAGQSAPAEADPAPSGTTLASTAPPAASNPAPSTAAESTLATTTIEMPPEAAGPLALREAAANGDALALFEIGSRYTEGRGVSPDLREAAKWYKYAADLGFAPAQYRLANFYEKGTGLDRDLSKAMNWYQMAAEQGNASAMHNLAVLYAMGQDGVSDYDSAGDWFTRAADLGVKDSQFNLAILHARGSGVPQDLEETYKWFAIAAKSGDKDAARKRDEVANALRPEQLESARAKVELWKPAALSEAANSVRIPPEWRGTDTRTASVDMEKAVRNIQAILTKNGFDTGGVDGVMGNKTIAAIKAFQTSVGLEPTGEVNDALVKELLARNN